MPTSKKDSKTETPQPGDPLFNLHHAEAEAALAAKNPVALTQLGLAANADATAAPDDDDDDATATPGPLDSQGQRRGQPTDPAVGSTAGHR